MIGSPRERAMLSNGEAMTSRKYRLRIQPPPSELAIPINMVDYVARLRTCALVQEEASP